MNPGLDRREELAQQFREPGGLLEVEHVGRALEQLEACAGDVLREMAARFHGLGVIEGADDDEQRGPSSDSRPAAGGWSGWGLPDSFSAR